MSVQHSRLTRPTLFSYCPVYLKKMICNKRKLISHKAKLMCCQFQDRKQTKTGRMRQNLNLKSKFTNCNIYTYPSDRIKHSLESSNPGSSRLRLKVLKVRLGKLILWICNSVLSWLCEIFHLTQKYRLSLWHFFNFVIASHRETPLKMR